MRNAPIRRSQLVSPFGVGSMFISPSGISMMPAGLDHWFEREDGGSVDVDEFRVEEWRLQRHLGVSHFRLPPDNRESWGSRDSTPNSNLTVPCVRFPQWHFCTSGSCRTLTELPLSLPNRQWCRECAPAGRRGWLLAQVPFIAVCEAGHIQDFPWREWVHRTTTSTCYGKLTLRAKGGASLAAQEVRCGGCDKWRSLAGITESSGGSTLLSRNLSPEKDEIYLCRGKSPWHGSSEDSVCALPIKGSLRSASNVYFSVMRSAIYLPRESQSAPAELISVLESPQFSVFLNALHDSGRMPSASQLRTIAGLQLRDYTDEQIGEAIRVFLGVVEPETPQRHSDIDSDDRETRFRRAEYSIIRKVQKRDQLEIREEGITDYGNWMSQYFDRVLLVDKLQETRALVGFERLNPQSDADFESLKKLLRRDAPSHAQDDWLPAYQVFGEGIYLELKADRLKEWESIRAVKDRTDLLSRNYSRQLTNRGKDPASRMSMLSARYLMVHTVAHLLMNRLTFDSGYGAAALRERLYVSADPQAPMASMLIYTASGDSEGTMGGLVRMGKPERLGFVVQRALEGATWCSSDPVCMEIGGREGQGPDSCNLAACHNCCLVPETSCESFNRFLDRGMIVGTIEDQQIGFFGSR